MTVLWFLGWGRFQSEITNPAEFLNYIFAVFKELGEKLMSESSNIRINKKRSLNRF